MFMEGTDRRETTSAMVWQSGSISAGMIEEYREHRRKQKGRQGTTLKVATINRDLALLKHLFSYAIREE
jgi:site-specific recombinase XerD